MEKVVRRTDLAKELVLDRAEAVFRPQRLEEELPISVLSDEVTKEQFALVDGREPGGGGRRGDGHVCKIVVVWPLLFESDEWLFFPPPSVRASGS